MPHVKVWNHFVWTTKNRLPLITDDIRQRVFQHIRENARAKAFSCLNGHSADALMDSEDGEGGIFAVDQSTKPLLNQIPMAA